MADAPTVALLGHHAVAAQDVAHGGAVRQIPVVMALLDQRQELLAAPGWMTSPRFKDCGHNFFRSSIRRLLRSSGSLLEPGGALAQVAVDPFVAGLARYAVHIAQLGDAQHLAQVICDELRSLVHRRRLAPRHGHLLRCPLVCSNCYLCPPTILLPMCPDRTVLRSNHAAHPDAREASHAGRTFAAA